MAVARFELTPSMPILARMEVSAANIDEPNANKNHIISSPNTSIDASGDLVDVHTNFMHLPAEILDLLGGPGPDRGPFNQPNEVSPPG